ncbi:MAG: tRNA pseudouridine(13) synthase TruD [Helicobacter sp.]|uniref:tRNA pseudouridine(13) synthase TruD n=1 Tax=Helicobacter sp. TaxID=218 RepID=UPI0025C14E4C|nr:tRNA pseudouridine(13) synthase TruD [Helicobacter sp.]MCH5312783.1 tRNA pseudouridine(13) synthase TruD [Helicobacter sp.]
MLIYPFSHSPCDCYFSASTRDFVVKEIPLYEPSGSGEHCFIYVRKKALSTFELLNLLSQVLGCKARDIGYAGLKDKAATTYQMLSIHCSLLPKLELAQSFLEEKQVKILHITPHHNKLKIGHLKGNRFFMRLKKCTPLCAHKLQSILAFLAQSGFPNYFGNQRFGKDNTNFESGRALAHHQMQMRNKKISHFLISSYQSHLFNEWLKMRIELSQILHHFSPTQALKALHTSSNTALKALGEVCDMHILKSLQAQKQHFVLLQGDVMCHYPFGKAFICDELSNEVARFIQRDIAPMGALSGTKLTHAQHMATLCETPYIDSCIKANGARRYAWVWAEDIESEYIAQKAHFELQFSLPKGSYATIFLEALLGRPLESSSQILEESLTH